ncbi:MAG: hypothetical protein HY553_17200 [Elusimicrobia bacterium]|nr:hypothetical protein [Elusimicrobiota bacterium]
MNDPRSRTLFRSVAAALLILDAACRWPNLEAFYTQSGFLPLHSAVADLAGPDRLTVLDAIHSLAAVRLFVLGGVLAALCWLAGWRSRLAHAACAVYFVSLLNRNAFVWSGGDRILALLLVLSLPLDTAGALSADRPGSSSHVGAPVLRLFIVSVYLFIAASKYGPTWLDGTALHQILQTRQYAGPVGAWLASLPLPALKALNWGVIALEWLAPLALLLSGRRHGIRRAALGLLAGLHGGIAFAFPSLAQFQLVMLLALTAWLEPADWDWLGSRIPSVGEVLGRVREALRRLPYAAQGEAQPGLVLSLEATVSALGLALFLHSYDRMGLPHPRLPAFIARPAARVHAAIPMAERWNFFAPDPMNIDGWWIADAETASGERIDLWTSRPVRWDWPGDFSARFDRFWRDALIWSVCSRHVDLQPYIAAWLLRRAEREGLEVRRLRMTFMIQRPPAHGQARKTPTPLTLWVGRPAPKLTRPG